VAQLKIWHFLFTSIERNVYRSKKVESKIKTGRRQLRIEELGETWLRRQKTHKGL
jgi:hypothetical protein